MTGKKGVVWCIVGAVLFWSATGCSRSYSVAVSVVDQDGRPVPDAIFYAEAYRSRRTFDFLFAQTDAEGRAPGPESAPLTLEGRPGTKLAVAVLATGKAPVVVYDALGRVEANGLRFVLEDAATAGRWNPRLAQLAYPFGDEPKLRRRLDDDLARPLNQAFREAYAALGADGESVLPLEETKRAAVREFAKSMSP